MLIFCPVARCVRHTPDAEHRYRSTRRFCQIAMFKRDGTFYKGSRYTTYPIISDITP